jgi:hypothetical protein
MKGSAFISQPVFFFVPENINSRSNSSIHSSTAAEVWFNLEEWNTEMMYFVLKGYGEVNNHTPAM